MLRGFAGAGYDLVPPRSQQGHGQAADPAGCAGHKHRAVIGNESVKFEPLDRQGRGEAGRPDDCRVSGGDPIGQRDDPLSRNSGIVGEAPVVGHTQFIAVDDDRLADIEGGGGHHGSHQVDTGDQRGDPSDPVTREGDHPVLVIDRRPADPDEDIPTGKVVDGQAPNALVDRVPNSFHHEGRKGTGDSWRGITERIGFNIRRVGNHRGYRTELMTPEHNHEPDRRNRSDTTAPFGWWPSPLSAAGVAAGRVSRSGLGCDGASLFWLESRPQDGGRQVVVGESGGGAVTDISPHDVSVRSRVHEYGGGAAIVSSGVLYFVDQADQRFYRMPVPEGVTPVPLTEPSRPDASLRYADGDLTPSAKWLVCIEERLGIAGTGHRLMAVATDGSLRSVALIDTGDFVAAPRVSTDGSRLAWVTWKHPNMSWDGSEVWCATLEETEEGIRIDTPYRVAGAGDIAVGQPLWCSDGSLVVVADRSGWWLPYRIPVAALGADVESTPVVDIAAEFHAPDWALGQSTMVELDDGSLVCRMHQGGRDHLVRLDAREAGSQAGSQIQVMDQPCVTIAGLAVSSGGRRLGILGATPTSGPGVYEVCMDGGEPARLLSFETPGPVTAVASDVALAQPFVANTEAGPVPGFFYAPTNSRVVGPKGARPPLVVFCHGGPTGAADPAFDPVVQFYTRRGFAVAGVDYRGSSGYGRAFRRSLQGRWGVADVEDCTAYALALAKAGLVDGRRMAIRGTSAGGFTAIGAMVASETFVGAVSWYGVTDLEALARTTHEFESRYLDGLVGPLPAAAAEYRRRSPIHHPAEVSGAVLLLQGSDDPVVPAIQSERYAAALSAHGVRCTIQVFSGESHGFRRAATIEASLNFELEFYRSVFNLEGAMEPSRIDEGDPGTG